MRFFRAVARQSHTQCGFFSSRLWLWALLLGNSALKNGTDTEKFKNTCKSKGISTFFHNFSPKFLYSMLFFRAVARQSHTQAHIAWKRRLAALAPSCFVCLFFFGAFVFRRRGPQNCSTTRHRTSHSRRQSAV